MERKIKSKLWLDDVRPMPDDFDYWAKTVDEAKMYILNQSVVQDQKKENEIMFISFDHDLGLGQEDGIELAKWLESKAYYGIGKQLKWRVHSANPVGVKNITATMQSCDRYWEKRHGKS